MTTTTLTPAAQALADNMLATINRIGSYVSFAELANAAAAAGLRWDGDYGVELRPGSHIYAWFAMSPDAIAALNHLINSGQIVMKPASVLTYHVDGAVPTAPVVKQPNRDYKSPRWAPVTINPANVD